MLSQKSAGSLELHLYDSQDNHTGPNGDIWDVGIQNSSVALVTSSFSYVEVDQAGGQTYRVKVTNPGNELVDYTVAVFGSARL